MPWAYLLLASTCEIVWAVSLKNSEGFTRAGPSIVAWVTMILSFIFLAQAVKTLPLGTAYAIWTGIGAAGTAVIGIIYFGEPRAAWRILCILLIVIGVVGLKFHGSS